MTKRKFLLQGIALTAFSLFFRITNIGYRAYLSGKIGAEGMGLYQLIFSVFLLAITLSTSGISLAVTRMVTAAIAANRRCTVRSVVTQCFLFCLTVSCTIAVLLLCFSDFAARIFWQRRRGAISAHFGAWAAVYVAVHVHEGIFFMQWTNRFPPHGVTRWNRC